MPATKSEPKNTPSMFRFTIRDVLWLMVVVAVALAIYFVRPRQPRWEYKEKHTGSGTPFDLTAEGNDGWELVHVESGDGLKPTRTFYFKRTR